MASYTTTAKYLLRRLTGGSNVQEIDDGIAALADDIDARMAGYAEGTLSARSAVTATAGKLYRTTDTGQVFMGTGSSWIEVGVSPWVPGDLKATWLTSAPSGWLVGHTHQSTVRGCLLSGFACTTYRSLPATVRCPASLAEHYDRAKGRRCVCTVFLTRSTDRGSPLYGV